MTATRIEIRVDAYTRLCLTAIAVLLTVMVLGLWAQTPVAAPALAADGFGDTGARIAAQLDEAVKTNAKLDQLLTLLSSGQVKVQVVKEKDDKGAGAGNAPKPKTN
jgi:hypothetical protein